MGEGERERERERWRRDWEGSKNDAERGSGI